MKDQMLPDVWLHFLLTLRLSLWILWHIFPWPPPPLPSRHHHHCRRCCCCALVVKEGAVGDVNSVWPHPYTSLGTNTSYWQCKKCDITIDLSRSEEYSWWVSWCRRVKSVDQILKRFSARLKFLHPLPPWLAHSFVLVSVLVYFLLSTAVSGRCGVFTGVLPLCCCCCCFCRGYVTHSILPKQPEKERREGWRWEITSQRWRHAGRCVYGLWWMCSANIEKHLVGVMNDWHSIKWWELHQL